MDLTDDPELVFEAVLGTDLDTDLDEDLTLAAEDSAGSLRPSLASGAASDTVSRPEADTCNKQNMPATRESQSLQRKKDHSLSVAWSPPLPSQSRLPVLPDSSSSEQLPISSSASQANLKRTITSKPLNFHTLNLFNNSLERILNLLLAAPHISSSPQSSSPDSRPRTAELDSCLMLLH